MCINTIPSEWFRRLPELAGYAAEEVGLELLRYGSFGPERGCDTTVYLYDRERPTLLIKATVGHVQLQHQTSPRGWVATMNKAFAAAKEDA